MLRGLGKKKVNRGGTDGPIKGRSGTLASMSTAEAMQSEIPTQGQSGQFDAEAPASVGRIKALKKLRRKA